ncbi:dachshund homolog 1 isoform X4 [Anas platyrhynchos]|uniref:Dachshund family transcription factor 1 n=1 Tax=Anas platyrhynchos platyrhynchos TaxID=8840 RepID=U3IZQ6_ANAPP|nr:dachshund homolog 1 isoform X3 [Anas platyrhynchos]XP_038043141.1 dachshund homolog 1 isoform X3 [Anas platyrhynchos]|eukprot:XP_027328670.1 dachshund homolog 1 isoform X3 [Anas platyrhynchos]
MAVPAALIPPTQLVPPQPPVSTSAACTTTTTTSSSSAAAAATSSPSPSIAPPPAASGTNLFRPEPIAAAAAAAATVTSTTTTTGGGNGGGGGSPSLGTGTGSTGSSSGSSSSSSGSSSTSAPNASAASAASSLPGKPVYSTPSPVENTPQNNECKMVDLRGAKVASFTVEGCELICLPQAFDLFLKHLVGGLHTVYTKLKRLEITPVVCNVEQVRILRGLGAIQPGVNRCKLISRKDFETLYNDCTNASSRPGRPPKRTQSVTSPENSHIMPHSVPGLMSPGIIPPTGLTAAAAAAAAATNAAIAEAMKVKKIKLEAMSNYHANNNQHGADSENGDLNSSVGSSDGSWDKEKLQSPPTQGSQSSVNHPNLPGQHNVPVSHPLNPLQQNHLLPNGLELPFMMMPHPLIPVSLPPASVTMAMSQMNHLSTIANMAAAAQVQSPPSRVETSVIKERVPDSPSPAPSLEEGRRPGSHPSSHRSSSVSSSPARTESSSDRIPAVHQNGLSMNQMLMGLSPNVLPGPKEGDLAGHDVGHESKRIHIEKDETPLSTPTARDSLDKLSLTGHGQPLPPGFPSPFLFPDGLSSIETLLTNIQGLLKVAIDNARAQEKQVQLEKTELKMELFREREMRETLEKQLAVEQKNRAIIQKRLKKEKKAKRKLQEALEFETKRREQAEQTLKQAASTDSLRVLNDSLTPEIEADRSGGRTDAERTIQGSLDAYA